MWKVIYIYIYIRRGRRTVNICLEPAAKDSLSLKPGLSLPFSSSLDAATFPKPLVVREEFALPVTPMLWEGRTHCCMFDSWWLLLSGFLPPLLNDGDNGARMLSPPFPLQHNLGHFISMNCLFSLIFEKESLYMDDLENSACTHKRIKDDVHRW